MTRPREGLEGLLSLLAVETGRTVMVGKLGMINAAGGAFGISIVSVEIGVDVANGGWVAPF